jgi:vacuolar-type H+-ATPase subunit D/Vma8
MMIVVTEIDCITGTESSRLLTAEEQVQRFADAQRAEAERAQAEAKASQEAAQKEALSQWLLSRPDMTDEVRAAIAATMGVTLPPQE